MKGNSPTDSSRAAYQFRVHRVLGYIDDNLAEPLELEGLAKVAAFSPFHFHRLFRALVGESLGAYIRRRRLEVAATRLITQPACSVTDIALGVGFQSVEAFSRAFKKRFISSPRYWRIENAHEGSELSKSSPAWSNPSHEEGLGGRHHGVVFPQMSESAMKVRIHTLRPASVAYLRYTGPYGRNVGKFWEEVVSPWLQENHISTRPLFGVSHDDQNITLENLCRYDACVEVPKELLLTRRPFRTILPGGRYAVLDFLGTPDEIGDAWTALLREWLPSSGLQLDHRPCFEHYPDGLKPGDAEGRFGCRICVPVVQL
ncbi:AraC family transcriptional regulator [Wenzhouxiangella sp. XN24]|uniref:AraC family transcriptional regulator n=1 Tax=Wenzhouxiangella sp. XN24 TaxID=2713569 RepID=UPI0013EC7F85|nr:AraC family transcriptional regulator [Wenzhouxiangella sp. XN24]NGX16578.1 AraC family transcriptional regulator [Wenzhouxiangella sp. XN24]